MQTIPIKQAIAIIVLLAAIFCTVLFLPAVLHTSDATQENEIKKRSRSNAISASPSFRFTSRPKAIIIKDKDDQIIYSQTEFDNDNEHTEFDNIVFPHDGSRISELQLVVEWNKQPQPFHFLSMEFNGFDNTKYATSATSDIFENIQIRW